MLVFAFAAIPTWSEMWSVEHERNYFWNAEDGSASWRLPAGATIAPAPPPLVEKQGWSDCTADVATLFDGGALHRAWRRIAAGLHPDKGGSSSGFQSATEVRDYLKSPLRFFAYRALHDHDDVARRRQSSVMEFGTLAADIASSAVVRGARPLVSEDADGWPRVTIEASLQPATHGFGRAHVWRLALAHADASTIEYKGDEASGGYDVCCHFVRGSACVLRPRDEVVAALANRSSSGGGGSEATAIDADGGASPAAGSARGIDFEFERDAQWRRWPRAQTEDPLSA